MSDSSDAELLEQFARNKSEAAFADLVERHLGLVYSTAFRKTGNPQHAEDIAQAVFIILARKANSLGRKTVLPGWLYHTARLTAANFQRAELRRIRREQEAFMQSTTNESAPDALWRELSPLLEDAMANLGPGDRDAIVLRFFQSRSMAGVSAALGGSEDAARMRVNRALEKLRKFFNKHGVVSTTSVIAAAISSNSMQAVPVGLAKTISYVALAKAVAASTSSLALAKGALKIMAWSKAKTTVVTASVVLLAGGLGLTTPAIVHRIRVAGYPDLQGAWEGTVHLDDAGVESGAAASTRVVFKFKRSYGAYTASADWIDAGRKNVPIYEVIYNYPSLTIKSTPRDTWSLKVNENATEMIWDHYTHFIQPDPATFKRTTKPDSVPDRLAEDDFAPRAGSDLQGYWQGIIGAGADAVPVDLKIAEDSDGTFRAEGDSPTEGRTGAPVTVNYNRPNVTVAVGTGGGRFDGTINNEKSEIVGSWSQNGVSIPATIRRADYQAEHAHDGEKDYSFHSPLDLQGHWKGTWIAIFNGGKTKVPIREALNIAKLPDGSYSATLVDLDRFLDVAPIPPSSFEYSPPRLKLKWNEVGGAYEAKLKGGRLVGTWSESGGGFPLVMNRTAMN